MRPIRSGLLNTKGGVGEIYIGFHMRERRRLAQDNGHSINAKLRKGISSIIGQAFKRLWLIPVSNELLRLRIACLLGYERRYTPNRCHKDSQDEHLYDHYSERYDQSP